MFRCGSFLRTSAAMATAAGAMTGTFVTDCCATGDIRAERLAGLLLRSPVANAGWSLDPATALPEKDTSAIAAYQRLRLAASVNVPTPSKLPPGTLDTAALSARDARLLTDATQQLAQLTSTVTPASATHSLHVAVVWPDSMAAARVTKPLVASKTSAASTIQGGQYMVPDALVAKSRFSPPEFILFFAAEAGDSIACAAPLALYLARANDVLSASQMNDAGTFASLHRPVIAQRVGGPADAARLLVQQRAGVAARASGVALHTLRQLARFVTQERQRGSFLCQQQLTQMHIADVVSSVYALDATALFCLEATVPAVAEGNAETEGALATANAEDESAAAGLEASVLLHLVTLQTVHEARRNARRILGSRPHITDGPSGRVLPLSDLQVSLDAFADQWLAFQEDSQAVATAVFPRGQLTTPEPGAAARGGGGSPLTNLFIGKRKSASESFLAMSLHSSHVASSAQLQTDARELAGIISAANAGVGTNFMSLCATTLTSELFASLAALYRSTASLDGGVAAEPHREWLHAHCFCDASSQRRRRALTWMKATVDAMGKKGADASTGLPMWTPQLKAK